MADDNPCICRLRPSQLERKAQTALRAGRAAASFLSHLVKKGSLRRVYYLRNQKRRKDAWPLPRIEESLDALSCARWSSVVLADPNCCSVVLIGGPQCCSVVVLDGPYCCPVVLNP